VANNYCANCTMEDEDVLNRCAKCLITFYCSTACQRQDWSVHASGCIPLDERGGRTLHAVKLEGESCCICFDTVGAKKTCHLECGHNYHNECFLQYVLHTFRHVSKPDSFACPQCRGALDLFSVGDAFVRSADYDVAEKMYLKLIKQPLLPCSALYRALSKVHLACYKLDKSAWAVSMAVLSECTVDDVVENKHVEGLIQEKHMQYNAAIDLLKFALARNPRHVGILFDLGRIFTMAQKYRAAKDCLQVALALDPSHSGARKYIELLPYVMKEVSEPPSVADMVDPFWGMCLGSFETMHDNDERALFIFRQIIRRIEAEEAAGKTIDCIMMSTAWSYIGRIVGDFDEAESAYLKSLQYNPSDVDSFIGMVTVCLQKSRPKTAADYAAKAIKKSPTSVVFYDLARIYANAAMLPEACSHVKRALKLRKSFPEARQLFEHLLSSIQNRNAYERAMDAYNAGRYNDALGIFRDLLASLNVPKEVEIQARYYLGVSLARLRDLDGAEQQFVILGALNPTSASTAFNLGVIRKDKHDYAGAIIALHESIRLDPPNAMTHFVLGNVLFLSGEHKRAEEAYFRASELEPGNDRFWCNLGIAVASRDDSSAIGYFLKAISLCASNVLALTQLASYLGRRGEYFRAIAYYTEAAQFPPVASTIYVNIGVAWYKLKCFPESEEALQKAVQIAPTNVQAHIYLGKVKHAQGEFLDAERHLIMAIELDGKSLDEEDEIMQSMNGQVAKASVAEAPG